MAGKCDDGLLGKFLLSGGTFFKLFDELVDESDVFVDIVEYFGFATI